MSTKALLTGVTGNVGSEVAAALSKAGYPFLAGVRNVAAAKKETGGRYDCVPFDFENPVTFREAFLGVEKLFLVRPPALADFTRQLKPVIDYAHKAGIRHIVFLSLLGIDRNPFPPHYKMEKYIQSLEIPYTFLRPGFFMQNLNQAHGEDIKTYSDIFIPAGNAKVSLIDTRDIGEIAAKILMEPGHENTAYTLTGREAVDYHQIAQTFTAVLGKKVTYSSPSFLKFRHRMRKRGYDSKYVNVMMALYLTTRLGMAKRVTADAQILLGRTQRSVADYIKDYKQYWEA